MEEKPDVSIDNVEQAPIKTEKKNTALYVIIAILAIAVVGLVVYIVLDKNNQPKTDQNNTSTETSQNEGEKPEEETKLVSKIDEDKDWVYDADYEKKVTKESHTDSEGNVLFSAKDIVAPYINVQSSYAETSNTAIKKVFDEIVKIYNADALQQITDCKYEKALNDKSVSVVYSYTINRMKPSYYTYNVNLEDGSELSYKEVYTQAGFTDDDIEDAVKKAVKDKMLNEVLKDFSKENMGGETKESYVDKVVEAYKKKVERGNLKYYLSDDNTLNVIINEYFPAQMSGREGVFEIK